MKQYKFQNPSQKNPHSCVVPLKFEKIGHIFEANFREN